MTKAELQRVRSLREKKTRESLGLFVVEGAKVVGELLAADFPFTEIYATAAWTTPDSPAIGRSVQITEEEMARISHFPTPSPVLAVGKISRPGLPLPELENGFTLALDGVQDPGNVGTLLRIADWYGFQRVVLSPDSADLFHQKVINASMGSFARVRAYTAELPALLAQFSAHAPQFPVLGCELQGDDVHALPALSAAIVVIGSEGRGLSPAVARQITRRVTIPRYGKAESLNAGVAAAVVCDNLRRASK